MNHSSLLIAANMMNAVEEDTPCWACQVAGHALGRGFTQEEAQQIEHEFLTGMATNCLEHSPARFIQLEIAAMVETMCEDLDYDIDEWAESDEPEDLTLAETLVMAAIDSWLQEIGALNGAQ